MRNFSTYIYLFIVLLSFACKNSNNKNGEVDYGDFPDFGEKFEAKTAILQPDTMLIPQLKKELDGSFSTLSFRKDANYRGEIWVVYSDRLNNLTYKTPACNEIADTIQFMETFYVAFDAGNCLRIVKDDMINRNGVFSNKAIDCGWIQKKNLLLWNRSIENLENKTKIKAVLINTVGHFRNVRFDEALTKNIELFSDPSLQNKTGEKIGIYRTFFIYKKNTTSYLIGTQPHLRSAFQNQDIKGWVDGNQVALWDHKVVIEPNWEDNAVRERYSNRKSSSFFYTVEMAEGYMNNANQAGLDTIWNNDTYSTTRRGGYWFRFPVLEQKGNIIKAGVMGNIYTSDGEVITDTLMKALETLREDMKLRRNFNIIFVIDGTLSMTQYFKAVSIGIESSMEKLNRKYSQNNIRFGALVYRDKVDGNGIIETHLTRTSDIYNSGSNSFMVSGEQYQVITNFLNTVKTSKNRNDDHPEAVFLGIKKAILQSMVNKKETNFLILIGDAGDNGRTGVNKSDIEDLLSEYQFHVFAYQANNQNDKSFQQFNLDIEQIALSTAQIRSQKIKNISNEEFNPTYVTSNGIKTLINSPTIVKIVPCARNKSLDKNILSTDIEVFIDETEKHFEKRFNEAEKAIIERLQGKGTTIVKNDNSDVYGATLSAGVYDILSDLGISHEALNKVVSEKIQFIMTGYTPIKIKGFDYPLYKYCLYLTSGQVIDLRGIMDKITFIRSSNEKRDGLSAVWKVLLKEQLGDQANVDEVYKGLTESEFNEIVFGLPSQNSLFKDLKLTDIYNINKVSDADIDAYIDRIKVCAERLDEVTKGNYPYSFYDDVNTYFWIPQDYLP